MDPPLTFHWFPNVDAWLMCALDSDVHLFRIASQSNKDPLSLLLRSYVDDKIIKTIGATSTCLHWDRRPQIAGAQLPYSAHRQLPSL